MSLVVLYVVICLACALLFAGGGGSRARRSVQLLLFAAVALFGSWGLVRYAAAERHNAQDDATQKVVAQFLSLPLLDAPSKVSEYYVVRSTARFADAPIRIIEYADPLCVDCRVFFTQMKQLQKEFAGKMNVVYQFFPLDARCNDVVEKDKHPGACDLSYLLAADTAKFRALYDEIHLNMDSAKLAPWRDRFARRHGLQGASSDSAVQNRVHALIETGKEYGRTSDKYSYGIRSTPTTIVNGRMLIGTLPIEQMRAILRALVAAHGTSSSSFMENWLEPGCMIGSAQEIKQCKAE